MAFKTLMLQLYQPSRLKRDLIDTALLRYSQSLQFLLDRYRGEIGELFASKARVTQQQALKLIDRQTLKELNLFGVQAFKDSLKIEFAAIVTSYIAQKRRNPNTGYPLVFLDESRYKFEMSDCIRQLDGGRMGRQSFAHRCARLVEQAERRRALYFGRYAMNRNYCLLYDELKDRFYAKLYLLNRAESIPGGGWLSGLSLKYVWADMPPLVNGPGGRRFVIVPLAFGKKQYGDLKEALKDPGLLRSARLVRKESKYYLMVNLECRRDSALETATTMGITRNALGGLNYTICGASGETGENGRILPPPDREVIPYFSRRVAEIALRNRSQVIVEANGGKNDRMPPSPGASGLSPGQYVLLVKTLNYKLPEKRLPPPVAVSANGLFLSCPNCGARTKRNLVSDELFACVACGYACESEWIGSESLAKRLVKYQDDKIPITIFKKEDGIVCSNQILGFECALPQGTTDFTAMYEELGRFLKGMEGGFIWDSGKYAVWKKLAAAPDPADAVRLLWK